MSLEHGILKKIYLRMYVRVYVCVCDMMFSLHLIDGK